MRALRTTIPRFAARGAEKWLRRQVSPRDKSRIMLPVGKMIVDMYPDDDFLPVVGANAYSPACLIAMAFRERRFGIRIDMLRPDDKSIGDAEMTDEEVVARVKQIFADENLHPALITHILLNDGRLCEQGRYQSVVSFVNGIAA